MTESRDTKFEQTFLARFRSDREAGREVGLAEYLGLFSGHEEIVAREYLRALAELRRGEGVGKGEQSDGNRLGPYQLLKELGRGGQGVVWLAEDARLGRKVALKVLSGLGPDADRHLARFRREAELASKLEHPGICGVHDTGIEEGVPYIAMRYVEGETLAEKLARLNSSGTVPDFQSFVVMDDTEDEAPKAATTSAPKTSLDRAELGRTIAVFEQAATALHAAHEVGIIHRDIKPGNLMIGKDGHPVLLDFGLARDDSDDAGPSLTQTGDLFGTPAYMSPEQITGRRVRLDRRSDIYSLGVTLYECLTLKRPFEAPTREALYQAILSKEAQPARRLNRQISTDLEVVLQCAMEKDRDKRYQTAADLAEDLRRVRSGEPILAKKVSLLGRAWRWSKRRPAAAALLGVLFLGIPTISGLGVWYWTHLDDVRAQEHTQLIEAVEDQLEIGFFELGHGDPEIALAAFEKGLALDAASAESAVGLALAHKKLRNPEAGLAVLEQAEAAITSPGVLIPVKADLLRSLGKTAQADALLSEAPKAASALAWFIAGTRAMNRGRDLGEYTPEGKAAFTEAEGHLHRAVLAGPRPRRAYHFALANAQGRCECGQPSVVADAIENLWPHSAATWHLSGFVLQRIDLQRSISASREAIRLNPDMWRAHANLGAALSDQGRLEEAVAVNREAIRLKPDWWAVHYNLGESLRRQGRHAEAVTAFREAIRLKPDLAEAHYNLGRVLSHLGDVVAAVSANREAIRLVPDDANAHNNLGTCLWLQGDLNGAIPSFREAIRLKPDNAEAYRNLGVALTEQGNVEDAVAAYREAIRLKPDHAVAHLNLGSALAQQGNLEPAVATLREAIRLNPEHTNSHNILGVVLAELGRFEEAVDACREAIRLKPDDAVGHLNLGSALAQQGKLEKAAVALREAVRLAPDDQRFQDELDSVLRLASSNDRVAELREAIREEPENPELVNELAWLLVDPAGDAAVRDPKKALLLARKAVELSDRREVRIMNTLGVALAANGELKEAVAVQEEILTLLNGQDHPSLKIADAQAALDRYRKALAAQGQAPSPQR